MIQHDFICVTTAARPIPYKIRRESFNPLIHTLSNDCTDATDLRTEIDTGGSPPSPADALTAAEVTALQGIAEIPFPSDTTIPATLSANNNCPFFVELPNGTLHFWNGTAFVSAGSGGGLQSGRLLGKFPTNADMQSALVGNTLVGQENDWVIVFEDETQGKITTYHVFDASLQPVDAFAFYPYAVSINPQIVGQFVLKSMANDMFGGTNVDVANLLTTLKVYCITSAQGNGATTGVSDIAHVLDYAELFNVLVDLEATLQGNSAPFSTDSADLTIIDDGTWLGSASAGDKAQCVKRFRDWLGLQGTNFVRPEAPFSAGTAGDYATKISIYIDAWSASVS